MTNTYFIFGKMEREIGIDVIEKKTVNLEVVTESEQAAIDYFEVDGWEWIGLPKVTLVSEAEKMRRAGAKPLFDLEELETGEQG